MGGLVAWSGKLDIGNKLTIGRHLRGHVGLVNGNKDI